MSISRTGLDEIAAVRGETSSTFRPTVADVEQVLFKPFEVLDHGFLRIVDYMGDDGAVVQAARVSYGRGTKKVNEDRALIRYLMRHQHTTPFEMCSAKFHVKLPIFVARQWIRHRTASVNEYSARYSVLDREFYLPDAEHISAQSSSNRQGRSDSIISTEQATDVIEILKRDAFRNYDDYLWMLNEGGGNQPLDPGRSGIARELARINLTLNTYMQWYWKTDLHNLFNFVRLRIDPHAQHEIRVYSEVLMDVLRRWVPMSFEAFEEYQLGAASLSRTAISVVRRLIAGEAVSMEESELSPREWRELAELLQLRKEV